MATRRWARWASFGALTVWLLGGCSSQLAETRGTQVVPAPQAKTVTDVQVEAIGRPAAALEPAQPAEPVSAPAPAPAEAAPAPAAVEPAAAVVVAQAAVEPVPVPVPAPVSAPAPAPAPEAKAVEGPLVLTAVEVKTAEDGTVATIVGSGPLAYEYFLVEGKSLVVDVAGAANKVKPTSRNVTDTWISKIRIGEHVQPRKATRVVFDLKKIGDYRVAGAAEKITVSFGAAAQAAAPPPPAAAVTVGTILFKPLEDRSRVEIPTSGKADFVVVDSGDPAKVVIEIANAGIAAKDQKALDLVAVGREVVKVGAFPFVKGDVPMVRVNTQLSRPVPFRVAAEAERIFVDFDRAAAGSPAPEVAAKAADAPAAEAAPAAPAKDAPAPAAAAPAFTGRKLSLDFKDADVNDILRLISEVSGLNFVAGSEVKGTVTIKLADVPWDQALDIILRTNQPPLAQIRESENIVRITTADKILDEEARRRRVEEDKKKTIDAQKALEPLVTKSYSISYGDVKKIGDVLDKSFKSERGKVQADERTNTLLVQDIQSVITQIDGVILTLDTPTPAVLVEARIVEVSSGFDQQVGIQWNLQGVKDAAHGNATPFAFPNSISVGGAVTQGTDGLNPGNYMVNLPAAAPMAGIGFSFGHVANTLNLDLKLSAMELLGKTKILSNPKVLVVQNQKAMINVGSQLPVPRTDSEGNRTVEWKDVGIRLDVKPQVTNDKRIFMEIQIEKSAQGENVQTTEGTMFSINTSRADTKVLIADGETTVIGGIYVQESFNDDSRVPGLWKLPVLGWLFRSKSDTENKRELMIFLTPRLVTI